MNQVLKFLAGKKTYIVGVLMIILGLYQGNDQMVMEGIATLTLRAAIAKV